ncbi:hypothetical protein [Saccharothrix stipae]
MPVAGRPLTVEVGTNPHFTSCAARYAGRQLTCVRVMQYGRLVLVATLLLALLAGVAAFLLYRGPRLEDDDRLRRTMITGLSSWVLAVVSSCWWPPPRTRRVAPRRVR